MDVASEEAGTIRSVFTMLVRGTRAIGAPVTAVSRDVTRRRGVVGWKLGKLGLARARLI